MKKVDLFGTSLKALSQTSSAQDRVNVFYDIHPDGDKNKIIVRGFPGLSEFLTSSLPQKPIRGMYQTGNYLYVVADNGLYQVGPTGSWSLLSYYGTSGQTTPVAMAASLTQLVIIDPSNGGGWYYQFSTLIETITESTTSLQNDLIDVVLQGKLYMPPTKSTTTPTAPTTSTPPVAPGRQPYKPPKGTEIP